MTSYAPIIINVTTPDGISHMCEGNFCDNDNDPYIDSINVPISIFNEDYFYKDDPDSLIEVSDIEEVIVYAINEGMLKDTWDEMDLSFNIVSGDPAHPVLNENTYYSFEPIDRFIAGKGLGSDISSIVISKNRYAIESLKPSYDGFVMNEHNSSQLSEKIINTVNKNISETPLSALFKAASISVRDKYNIASTVLDADILDDILKKANLTSTLDDEIRKLMETQPANIERAINKILNNHPANAGLIQSAAEKELYLTRKSIAPSNLEQELPLISGSSKFNSLNTIMPINGESMNVTAHFEEKYIPGKAFEIAQEAPRPLLLVINDEDHSKVTVMKGESLDALTDKINNYITHQPISSIAEPALEQNKIKPNR
jgi:hypothetical protein